MSSFILHPIGFVNSCFRERFGIPRQPGLVSDARAILTLDERPGIQEAVQGLEGFSHIWVIFLFHGSAMDGFKPKVRPPRLGGKRKVGVLATRSPHRPNPIGLSLVELEKIDGLKLHLKGIDLLDGTPVLDVKPYLPYADQAESARMGWVGEQPEDRLLQAMPVEFSPEAQLFCQNMSTRGYPRLAEFIHQTLTLDPRPAFQAATPSTKRKLRFAARLSDFDVHWEVKNGKCTVIQIRDCQSLI